MLRKLMRRITKKTGIGNIEGSLIVLLIVVALVALLGTFCTSS